MYVLTLLCKYVCADAALLLTSRARTCARAAAEALFKECIFACPTDPPPTSEELSLTSKAAKALADLLVKAGRTEEVRATLTPHLTLTRRPLVCCWLMCGCCGCYHDTAAHGSSCVLALRSPSLASYCHPSLASYCHPSLASYCHPSLASYGRRHRSTSSQTPMPPRRDSAPRPSLQRSLWLRSPAPR
jgi:hypothetical protein